MELLTAVFAVFALASVVALVRFEGNPLFVFSFLLSATCAVWLFRLARDDGSGAGRRRSGRKPRR